jgi:hypothetical protein
LNSFFCFCRIYLTYDEIVELISFDCKIFELVEITGLVVIAAAAAKRRFCLSCTDKRGFDLIK